jgi:hypothetical protein
MRTTFGRTSFCNKTYAYGPYLSNQIHRLLASARHFAREGALIFSWPDNRIEGTQ